MNRLTSTIVMAVLSLFVAASESSHALADEKKFTRLTGKDIRLKVIGKEMTDGVHWSDYFEKDGVLVSWSIGRKHTGKWQIRGDELCIAEDAGDVPTCYELWAAGNDISLRLDGVDTTFAGYLRQYGGR
ncbi:MAG TPA: hypothetical protein VKB68_14930 [Stellaceae bacterium]|nr:hypothetical protein [Stellaceae bacterium]